MCPQCMNEIYKTTNQNNTVTRNSSLKLLQLLLKLFQRTKGVSQKCLSYLRSYIWNGLPDDIKLSNKVNTFKHKVKYSSYYIPMLLTLLLFLSLNSKL